MAPAIDLTGKKKAAVALVVLGPEISSQIFKHLDDAKIEQLTLEIANLGSVPSEVRRQVMDEFFERCDAQEFAFGGVEYVRQILEQALGPHRAAEIIEKISVSLQQTPFSLARQVDPAQLANLIENEHPQTIALVLAYLRPEQAAAVLSSLPDVLQTEVALRLAGMDRTAPEVVAEVEKVLESKLFSIGGQDYNLAGGTKALVDILNRVDRATEKTILEELEEQNPVLAEEVKNLMFVFEDITLLDDRAIQTFLKEIDMKDLALALKAASEEVKKRIFSNMSERAAEMLREDMEFMGPVRLRVVEEAQQRIVTVIRRLEESGDIVIARGAEDEVLV
ncbi:MAG: flagellar motor switch protein FliG [Bacillota bacterium]